MPQAFVPTGYRPKWESPRTIVCDARHACSCQACNHACELVIIIFCFGATAGVFALLVNSKQLEKERKQARADDAQACQRMGSATTPHPRRCDRCSRRLSCASAVCAHRRARACGRC